MNDLMKMFSLDIDYDAYFTEGNVVPGAVIKHVVDGSWDNGELFSGCHSYSGYRIMLKKGYMKENDFVLLPNGVRQGYVTNHPRIKQRNITHTFFPEDWDDKKIRSAIKEVWKKHEASINNDPPDVHIPYLAIINGLSVTVGFKNKEPVNAFPTAK